MAKKINKVPEGVAMFIGFFGCGLFLGGALGVLATINKHSGTGYMSWLVFVVALVITVIGLALSVWSLCWDDSEVKGEE